MHQRILSDMLLWLLLIFLLTGCAGLHAGNYGRFQPSKEATEAFETFQIKPDYHYYYSGADEYPSALVGLSKQYILMTDLWKKIEPTPKSFRDTVKQMQTRGFQVGHHQHGFLILDHRGNALGIWYSILPATTVIQMLDQQRVIIYTPDVDTYIKYEDRESS